MINRVILVGNLTRDSEAAAGPATTWTRMRVATNAVWRDAEGNRQESAEFHTVVAFGRLAEICASYCVKGRRVYIEGRLRHREYDGTDGIRRHSTEIVAETMKLLDRPQTDDIPVHPDASAGTLVDTDAGADERASGDPTPPRRRREAMPVA